MQPRDLERAAVCLRIESRRLGTGFFVAPHLVATCAHVVGDAPTVTVECDGTTQSGTVIRCERQDSIGENAFPDVAIIRVPAAATAILILDGSCRPGDHLYAWGFPRLAQHGDSVEGECEGFRNFGPSDAQRLIKFKQTQITEGFSGSPVLNLRTGGICGMLKRTRDESSPAGGYAVRAAMLLRDEEIAQAQGRIETTLRVQLRTFLDRVIAESGALPAYFPPHIRSFDNIRQRVRVVVSSQAFAEVVKLAHLPVVAVKDAYDPLHSRPEDVAWDSRSIFDRSFDRWRIARLGAVEWERLRTDSRFSQLVVLGDTGYGKTWLLRYEARIRAVSCKSSFGDDLANLTIPLIVKLQDLAQHVAKTQTLAQTIDLALEAQGFRAELRAYVNRQLANDRVALLLDAWDEVHPEYRNTLRGQIENWMRGYKGPALITSRFAGFRRFAFGDAPVMELLALERSEIIDFARVWFAPVRAKRFLDVLSAHPAIGGLARIPLMLVLLCRAFDDPTRALPLRRGELCERCLHGLLKDWKRDDKAAEVDDLDVEHIISELGRIALALFPRSQFSITELRAALGVPYKEARPTIDALIENGILVRTDTDPDGRLAFLHRTFHEWLVARRWATQPWDELVFDARSWDVTWTQVIVYLAGQHADAGWLIAKLADPQQDDAVRSRLALAIRCLQEARHRNIPHQLVDTITQQALAVWLDHARNGTTEALVGLEKAIPVLAQLDETNRRLSLEELLIDSDAVSFLDLVAAIGPDVATPAILERLTGLVNTRDSPIRVRAMNAVARVGSRISADMVVPALVEAASDRDWELNVAALTALESLGEEAATPELLTFLTEGVYERDIPARWIGPDLLASIGPNAAAPAVLAFVIRTLRDARHDVREYAANVAVAISEHVPEAFLGSLVDAIRETRSPARTVAARILASMERRAAKPEVLMRLCDILTEGDSQVAGTAAWVLGNFQRHAATPEVLDRLLQLLGDDRSDVRSTAAYAIGQMERIAARPDVIDALIALTTDEDWMTRWKAAEALGRIGELAAAPALLERLVGWLRDGDWVVRWKAAETLGLFAGSTSIASVLGSLAELMAHPNPEVRGRAASVVGRMGANATDPETLRRLELLTADDHREVRAIAIDALTGVAVFIPNAEKVIYRMLDLSLECDPGVRAHAVQALGRLGKVDAPTRLVDRLVELLVDGESQVTSAALRSLAGLRRDAVSPEVVSRLVAMAREEDPVGARAIAAFAEMGDAAAAPTVLLAVTDGYRFTWLVGRLGPSAATPAVLNRLLELGGEGLYLQRVVLQTLGRLGQAACIPAVLSWVDGLLHDGQPNVRRRAATTLRALQLAGGNLRAPAS